MAIIVLPEVLKERLGEEGSKALMEANRLEIYREFESVRYEMADM